MKTLLICILTINLALLAEKGNATTYYFSTTDGDDSRSTSQAQSSSTPWKTLSKLNSFMGSLQSGDVVSFKSGDTFLGGITVTKAGITFNSYGSGAKPVISGFYTVPSWSSVGGNLWSAVISSAPAMVNMVTINNTFQPIGRWPKLTASNGGYLTYQSFSGTSSITSSGMSGAASYVGGEVVIRADHYNIDRGIISSQSSNTVSYKMQPGGPLEALTNNFGFFFQNHPNACTQQGDWCFIPGSKTVEVYSSSTPSNVNVSVVANNVSLSSASNCTFQNLAFVGSNTAAFAISNSSTVKITGCDISFAGVNGISTSGSSSSITVDNSTLTYVMNNGIDCNSTTNWLINATKLNHIGDIAGMGVSGDGEYVAMAYIGNNSTVQNNAITNCGYHGIQFGGSAKNFTVQNNLVQNFCLVKDDGGGIYTYKNSGTGSKIIQHNIVLDGIGAPNGTSNGMSGGGAIGIYSDGQSDYLQVLNNTVGNITDMGFLTNDGLQPILRGNTFFNCGTNGSGAGAGYVHWSGQTPISNLTIKRNIFCAKTASQFTTLYLSNETSVAIKSFFGSSDSNWFAKPISSNPVILTQQSAVSNLSIAQWQSSYSQDMHSKGSPMTVSDVNSIRFEYNASSSSKTVNLGATYMDIPGTTYSGSITLAPYSSAVLLYVSGTVSNQPPVANAGPDQNVTLPVSTASLNGSGTDPDGTISSYQWTKISGPSQYSISSASSAQTTVTGLAAGVYQFTLTVTDNAGATDKDTMTITVNPSSNQPPIARAGASQVVILPISTVILDGSSSSDPDGTITSYSWSKISGPASAIILTPGSAVTTVTTLVQGVYVFELKVTDNSGASSTSDVTISVNAAANQLPTANAGSDLNITLPVSTVTLTGSGSDPDGNIASYQWTRISGPGQYTIVSGNQAQTSITDLAQGIYTFELKVTDNNGGTDVDDVTVTVNAAPVNKLPTANAGNNITITLPVNTVTLLGSGTDPDGTIVAYDWTKISGPGQFQIPAPNQGQTSVTNLVQGTYVFELEVTDNSGATDVDDVTVIVNTAPNQLPTANAGNDINVTLPVNTINLLGSGNDPDGTIASYQWTKVSGPSQYSIAASGQAQTAVNNLVQGVYVFELKVTDNSGGTDVDDITVIVNPAPNQLPSANAGNDISITLPLNSVTLTGSGSDPDGTISAYHWTKISGPNQYTIVSAAQAQTSVNNLVQGTYVFELKVTDNSGGTAIDDVTVTVNAAPVNQLPNVNAGTDISVTLPLNSVTLVGSGNDPDGTISSYLWTRISGPTQYNITSAAQPLTSVNNLAQGTYVFELKVTDNSGGTATDDVTVTVNAAPVNQLPNVNAGNDITITLPSNTVNLLGSGNDPDGTVSSYQWTRISGPTQYSILAAGQAQTTVSNLIQGNYVFELKVTDNQGASATDDVTVIVNPAPVNQPPVANAGGNITITLPTNTVRLNGTAGDADGSVASIQWAEITGPTQYIIVSANQAQTDINNLVQGTYVFELTVTDNQGAVSTSDVTVTVNPAPNVLPSADAGSDQTITLPVNTVTLNGVGNDPDGNIASYQWTKVSGPSQFSIANADQPQTAINNLTPGVYQFELMVTDNSGGTARDVVNITVIAAANQLPIADAGADQNITLPVNSITLNGDGNDPDGTIISFQWTKISGPFTYHIVSSGQQQTTVNNLVQGTYRFVLKVTDNSGASARDTVSVVVNPAPNQAPTADAGRDFTITLPNNSVSLTGRGNDPDGNISSYQWTEVSGPAQYNIQQPTRSRTTINNLVEGVYVFALTVTDNSGATAQDQMQITVNPVPQVPNQDPAADAGTDIEITLPTNNVTLNGSGNDPDGTVASYLWTMISGPAQFTIASADQAQTAVTGLSQGSYEFELVVTDNQGATATDTVTVTVDPGANQSPTVDAGSDITITLPANSATLTANANDPDGTIASYQWTKISGPDQYNMVSADQGQTIVDNLVEGVYQFEIAVTDNQGAVQKDTITITVNAAVNQAPSANAGNDIAISLPINSVSLNGSGADVDGTIDSYQWTKISGPSQFSIISASQAQTLVNGLVEGNYQFELTVTDNKGATGKDTVTVIVGPLANQSPTANAGQDIAITLPTNTVTLAGTGLDVDGTISSYQWTKISGPFQYNVVSADQSQTIVRNLVEGVYRFRLVVTDNAGATGSATVTVTVNPAPPNQPPVADAGTDITTTLPTNTVTLNGKGTDQNGVITTYTWTKVAGPTRYSLLSPNKAKTTLNNLMQGVYRFKLTVTDNGGASATDTVQVTVNAAGQQTVNQLPTANAGADVKVSLPTSTASLTGAGTDPDGTIAGYQWTKISGPSQFTIVSGSQAQTSVTGLAQGVYQFVLTVTDNKGATASDTMTVTVANIINQAPTANAGADINITLPLNSITLNGSGTDPDGSIAGYQWTKVSGPSQFNIVSGSQAQTTVNNLASGIYKFVLKVTDDQGATARDTMQVIVNVAPNQAPIANAGTDITITLPLDSTKLTGSATDPDGTIASYKWTKISGPTQYTMGTSTIAQPMVSKLTKGIYFFELKVTDNSGASAKDTVQVTVKSAAQPTNQAPVANAGADQDITLPVNSAILAGTGTDADGTIAGYQWTLLSGPTGYSLPMANQAQVTITNLPAGQYQVELKVTDNLGATGKDTVLITVDEAIIATAKVYPNPASSNINIEIRSSAKTATTNMRIYDSKGTPVYQETFSRVQQVMTKQVNISRLPNGVYYVEMNVDDTKILTLPFIKQN